MFSAIFVTFQVLRKLTKWQQLTKQTFEKNGRRRTSKAICYSWRARKKLRYSTATLRLLCLPFCVKLINRSGACCYCKLVLLLSLTANFVRTLNTTTTTTNSNTFCVCFGVQRALTQPSRSVQLCATRKSVSFTRP